jgi:hypothetical protein
MVSTIRAGSLIWFCCVVGFKVVNPQAFVPMKLAGFLLELLSLARHIYTVLAKKITGLLSASVLLEFSDLQKLFVLLFVLLS